MAKTRLVWAIVAAGLLAGGMSGCSKSETPSSAPADAEDVSVAVGTGEFIDSIVGFTATGDTNEEAMGAVILACQKAGGVECTADEVTNDKLCIVSVASDATDVVAGGAGATVEEARLDAIKKAEANKTPVGQDAVVVVSSCP